MKLWLRCVWKQLESVQKLPSHNFLNLSFISVWTSITMQKLSIRWIITNHDSAMLMHPLFKAIQSIFSMWWISSQSALFVHRCRKSKSRFRFKKNRWKPLPCVGEAFRKRISLNYYGQRFNKYLGHAGWSRVGEWLASWRRIGRFASAVKIHLASARFSRKSFPKLRWLYTGFSLSFVL